MKTSTPSHRGVKMAFRMKVVLLKTENLVPSKQLDEKDRGHQKYLQIASSLQSVGSIEPLVVYPGEHGTYRVLDGHKRLEILKTRKVPEVECLISTDDEGYTYNRRANYLSSVGEHQMILRALRYNSEETIAAALNVNVSLIRKKRDLLDGICPEAIEILKDRRVPPYTFAILRKMRSVRQIEAAELMISSNLYSQRFAEALLAGTSDDMLIAPVKTSPANRKLSADQKARIVSETDSLLRNSKMIEESYGAEALTLSVCCRYTKKLLENDAVSRYIAESHPDISAELGDLIACFIAESSGNNQGQPQLIERRGVGRPRHRPTDDARTQGPRVRPRKQ